MGATITAPEAKRITLCFREGSSDKVYQASIEPLGELFVVNFAFGRRGSTSSTGTKTPKPADLETATRIYEKLVREKMAKAEVIAEPNGKTGCRMPRWRWLRSYLSRQ